LITSNKQHAGSPAAHKHTSSTEFGNMFGCGGCLHRQKPSNCKPKGPRSNAQLRDADSSQHRTPAEASLEMSCSGAGFRDKKPDTIVTFCSNQPALFTSTRIRSPPCVVSSTRLSKNAHHHRTPSHLCLRALSSSPKNLVLLTKPRFRSPSVNCLDKTA